MRHSSRHARVPPPGATGPSRLTASLRDLARKRGPHAKMPTVREICDIYDTNWAAIDTALRELEKQEVIYRRQGSGIFVSPHVRRKTIAILLESLFFRTPGASPYWGMLWGACADEAQKRAQERDEAYEFRIFHSDFAAGDQVVDRTIADLETGHLHGAIAIGLRTGEEEWEARRSLPLVTYAGIGHWIVETDQKDWTEQAIQDLAAKGCRRIGWLTSTDLERFVLHPDGALDPRYFEYYQAEQIAIRALFHRLNLPVHETLIYDNIRAAHAYQQDPSTIQEQTSHQAQGYAAALQMFSQPRTAWPDGLLIWDDMMTRGVLAAFHQRGVRLGQDVHICSHSNAHSIVLYGWEDQMARIEIDPVAVAQALFGRLDRLMAGDEPEDRVITVASQYLPCLIGS